MYKYYLDQTKRRLTYTTDEFDSYFSIIKFIAELVEVIEWGGNYRLCNIVWMSDRTVMCGVCRTEMVCCELSTHHTAHYLCHDHAVMMSIGLTAYLPHIVMLRYYSLIPTYASDVALGTNICDYCERVAPLYAKSARLGACESCYRRSRLLSIHGSYHRKCELIWYVIPLPEIRRLIVTMLYLLE